MSDNDAIMKELREIKALVAELSDALNFDSLVDALRELRRPATDDFCPSEDDDDESDS